MQVQGNLLAVGEADCFEQFQVICPYCGTMIDDEKELVGVNLSSNDKQDFNCLNCKKTFEVEVLRAFITYPKGGWEQPNFKKELRPITLMDIIK